VRAEVALVVRAVWRLGQGGLRFRSRRHFVLGINPIRGLAPIERRLDLPIGLVGSRPAKSGVRPVNWLPWSVLKISRAP
jgi:hypothetical protein